MNLIVSSSELLKAILTVSKAIPTRASEAILEDYLMELKGNKLRITASDKEITLITEIEVEKSIRDGKIAIPAQQITELLKQLPDQPISICSEENNSFKCEWANGISTLPYFNPEDYPELRTVEEENERIEMPSETLIKGISNTLYAASNDESRAVMSSIYFDITPDNITFVASDLQRLICCTSTEIRAEKKNSFILNRRHAAILKSIVEDDISNMTVKFDEKTIVFEFGNTRAICCGVVGKYPAYKSIIPQNNSNVLRISRSSLLNMVRRISVCSPKASNLIKIDLFPGGIEVSAQDTGFEIAAHEKAICRYDGDNLTIGFKSTHIIEILSNLSCDEVMIKFADKRSAALIMPSPEEDAENVFAIVMPVTLRR